MGIGIYLFAAGIGLLLFAAILKALLAQLNKAKCPDCKKRNVTAISLKMLRAEEIFFKEKETIKDFNNTRKYRTDVMLRGTTDQYLNPPEKVTVREVMIPGKRTWYKVDYKCNHCGKTFYREEYRDEKPTVVSR